MVRIKHSVIYRKISQLPASSFPARGMKTKALKDIYEMEQNMTYAQFVSFRPEKDNLLEAFNWERSELRDGFWYELDEHFKSII